MLLLLNYRLRLIYVLLQHWISFLLNSEMMLVWISRVTHVVLILIGILMNSITIN